MSADQALQTTRNIWTSLQSWSIDNRLREWLAGSLAVASIVGMGGPLLFDTADLEQTITYHNLAGEVRLYWIGIAFILGGLLVLAGLLTPKNAPSGFAFAGGLTLAFFYGAVALSLSSAMTSGEATGAASTHVSMYSWATAISLMVTWLYRTRRKN